LKDLTASLATKIESLLGQGRSKPSLTKGKTAEVAELLGEIHSPFSEAHPVQMDNKLDGFG
jgi:hypothetical protein